MTRPAPPAAGPKMLQTFWFGMAGSVILLGVALIVMDQQLPRHPLAPDLDMLLKGLALASLVPFFIFRKIYTGRVIGSSKPADPAQEHQRRMVQLTVGASLAELPLMIMLAYVAIGGPVIWGILAWIATFAMIMMIRPESGRVI